MAYPLDRPDQPIREELDIESEAPGSGIGSFFFGRQEIEQERGEEAILELTRDESIARAETAAPAAVSEDDESARRTRDREVAREMCAIDRNGDGAFVDVDVSRASHLGVHTSGTHALEMGAVWGTASEREGAPNCPLECAPRCPAGWAEECHRGVSQGLSEPAIVEIFRKNQRKSRWYGNGFCSGVMRTGAPR